jgi:type IV pilus assembly protein PilA
MFSLTLPKRDERGFTLIELLVVIIIIGVLAAIAIPLFLDQRKLAVDASVKSDVRNTATQVQAWLAQNPNTVATDVVDYKSKGGNISQSTSDTVNLSVATDGSFLVCGYAGTAAKNYTASSAAYVFDSTTGRFGAGSCSGGIVGAGSPSATTSAPTGTVIFTSTFETGDTSLATWNQGNLVTTQAHAGTRSITEPYSTGGATTIQATKQLVNGKVYTFSGYAKSSTTGTADKVNLQVSNSVEAYSGSVFLSQPLTTGQWTAFSFTFTVNSAAVSTMSFYGTAGTGGGGNLYLDDVTLTQTN